MGDFSKDAFVLKNMVMKSLRSFPRQWFRQCCASKPQRWTVFGRSGVVPSLCQVCRRLWAICCLLQNGPYVCPVLEKWTRTDVGDGRHRGGSLEGPLRPSSLRSSPMSLGPACTMRFNAQGRRFWAMVVTWRSAFRRATEVCRVEARRAVGFQGSVYRLPHHSGLRDHRAIGSTIETV